MFDNFTFGALPQVKYDCEISASPTDILTYTPRSSPPTLYQQIDSGLEGIVQRLERHSLSRENLVEELTSWSEEASSPLEVDSEDDEMTEENLRISTYTSPLRPFTITSGAPISCRRLQRQLNVQMQCSPTHIRDINTLVEDMITSSSQCRLYKPASRYNMSNGRLTPPPSRGGEEEGSTTFETSLLLTPSLEVDEGFHEDDTPDDFLLRRAATPSGIRKYNGLNLQRSTDVIWDNGKLKVRNKPRMRKRRPKTD